MTLKRDNNKHLASYEERIKTLKIEKRTSPTSEGDNSVKTSAEGYKTIHGDGNITLSRGDGGYSTPIRDELSTHGPRHKRSMYLTPNGGDNTYMTTSRLGKRGGEENLEIVEAKIFPPRYTSQSSIMSVTGQSAYFVRISVGAENNIIHPVTCLFDKWAQPSLI